MDNNKAQNAADHVTLQVRKFVADFTGVQLSQVDQNSKLVKDLKICGFDGEEFLDRFEQKFRVSTRHWNRKKIFGDDVGCLLTLPFWLVVFALEQTKLWPIRKDFTADISVADLVALVEDRDGDRGNGADNVSGPE